MRAKKCDSGRRGAPASKRGLLLGGVLLAAGAAFFAFRPQAAEEPPARPGKVAALTAPSPSPAFRRANWKAPAPKEDTGPESYFGKETKKPPAPPGALAHLDGVEIVFPVPEEGR